MSNIINTYLVSIGQQLANKIPPPTIHIQQKLMALKVICVTWYFSWGGEYGKQNLL